MRDFSELSFLEQIHLKEKVKSLGQDASDALLEEIAKGMSYEEYLDSELWRRKKWQAMGRDLGKCRDCGQDATEVHHLRYPEVYGQEILDDLVSLCRGCHQLRHRGLGHMRQLKRCFSYVTHSHRSALRDQLIDSLR